MAIPRLKQWYRDSVRTHHEGLRTCGERYYDRATMRRLERVRDEVAKGLARVTVVGRVLQVE